jgi:hypothetical protein
VLGFGLPSARLLRELERPHLLAQELRVKERFGFESHLPADRVFRAGGETKHDEHRTGNSQQPTSKAENSGEGTQSHLQATNKPATSQLQANRKPPTCARQATLKLPQGHPQAWKGGRGLGMSLGECGKTNMALSFSGTSAAVFDDL